MRAVGGGGRRGRAGGGGEAGRGPWGGGTVPPLSLSSAGEILHQATLVARQHERPLPFD